MMRRTIAALVAALAMSLVTLAARQDAPAGQAPSTADDNWKPTEITNLTVLPKDMPVDDVMKIMKVWNTVLNVDCVFCHVGQVGKPLSTYDFASDNKKRKETSRIMLRMVMDSNEKFKAVSEDEPPQISCATCHKRSRHVEDTLPAEPPKDNH
jgi:Photosynthetic reaction centre cytochrome C subunit